MSVTEKFWEEFASEKGFGQTDIQSWTAFDGGFIAGLRWLSEKYGSFAKDSTQPKIETIWLTISRIASEEADVIERGMKW